MFPKILKSWSLVNRLNVRWFRRLSQESVCEHEQIRIWNFNFRGGWSRRKKAKADRNEFALWAPGGKSNSEARGHNSYSRSAELIFQTKRRPSTSTSASSSPTLTSPTSPTMTSVSSSSTTTSMLAQASWISSAFFQFEFFFFSVFVSNLERC